MDPNEHHNALDLNARLHWYEIKSILGQGGFGITYLAYDTNLKHRVAIKEYMPVEFSTRDASNTVQPISENHGKIYRWGLKRFLEEAQTLARFKHPNIIRVHSFFEENNTGYIIMDYENGVELAQLIRDGVHFDEQRLLGIVMPILDGLEEVHKSGIIHRDIKPANIFIRSDQSPVLLDFGSARHAISGQTRTMTSLVTPGFAPFEQYHEAEGKQGPWTDIYALGATAHCMITGKPPPEALKRGMMQFEHDTDIYLELADSMAGKYSDSLLKSIDCALRFREKDRPQTVGAWKQMIADGKPVPAPQPRRAGMDDVAVPTTKNLSAQAKSKKAGERVKRPLWPLARTAIVLALLGGGGWYLFDNQREIKQWIDAYIEGIAAKQLAAQERAQEARRQELLRQEELKQQLEEEARLKALEQEKNAQRKREQRKQELLAELNELEQQSGEIRNRLLTEQEKLAAEKALQDEKNKLEQEKRRLAEAARQEERARLEAERKLQREQEKLEQEKQRLALLQQHAEAEKRRQAEAERQQELARQEEERKRKSETEKQKAELARLEQEKKTRALEVETQKRLQEELARKLTEKQDLQGLTFEDAITRVMQAITSQSGSGGQPIDRKIVEEIVRLRMEKLRAEEEARILAANTVKAKRRLNAADRQLEYREYEPALDEYRKAYNLEPTSLVRFLAVKGIISSMEKLYPFGSVENLPTFDGNGRKNLSGQYWSRLTWSRPNEAVQSRYVPTLVAHMGNQLILVPPEEGVAIIADVDDGEGGFEFYDIERNIIGSGKSNLSDSSEPYLFTWESEDKSASGSWHAEDYTDTWIIDITGKYTVEVSGAPRNLFRKKVFDLDIKDESADHVLFENRQITALSEDENIVIEGRKALVRRIFVNFVSKYRGMYGRGEWHINEDGTIDGTWKLESSSEKGEWKLTKVQ